MKDILLAYAMAIAKHDNVDRVKDTRPKKKKEGKRRNKKRGGF